MLFVLLFHCMTYYQIMEPWMYSWFIPFYVSTFYFVSGYLLLPKCLRNESLSFNELRQNLERVLYHLVLPTMIFSSLVYLPKIFFNGNQFFFKDFIYDVVSGNCFWFTSSIAIAHVIILLSIFLLRIQNEWTLAFISLLFVVSGFLISKYDTGTTPWFYKSGMLASFFLALGGLYQRYELKIEDSLSSKKIAYTCLLLYVLFHYFTKGQQVLCGNIELNYNLLGWIATLLGIITVVNCCKLLPDMKFLSFMGKNTLIFYFLSGLFPASLSTFAIKIVSVHNWLILIVIYISSIVVSSITVVIINKYFHFLVDIRTFHIHRNRKSL